MCTCGFFATKEETVKIHMLSQLRGRYEIEKCILTTTYRAGEGDDENPLAAMQTNHMVEEIRDIKWTHERAESEGRHWHQSFMEEFEKGVIEKQVSRGDAKFIRKEGSFPKFIPEEMLPIWKYFKGCTFESIQGLCERCIQMQRSKMHELLRRDQEMWGPKKARMKASQAARKTHQLDTIDSGCTELENRRPVGFGY
jgi:hypothetical protein